MCRDKEKVIMDTMIGKKIEFKNARKDITQTGEIIDKILYKENPKDDNVMTGYLVKCGAEESCRVVKPIRVIKVIEPEYKIPSTAEGTEEDCLACDGACNLCLCKK